MEPDPENKDLAVGISLRSPIYLRLMAAIFDSQYTQTLQSILISLFVLPDPKNLGIAVGMSLLSCVETAIRVTEFTELPSLISEFRLLNSCPSTSV